MVSGLHLYSAFLTSQCFTILPNIQPFMQTFTHQRRCQPCKATASLSGAIRVRYLAQRHLDTRRRPGIELATFRLPANPLYLLSHMQAILSIACSRYCGREGGMRAAKTQAVRHLMDASLSPVSWANAAAVRLVTLLVTVTRILAV